MATIINETCVPTSTGKNGDSGLRCNLDTAPDARLQRCKVYRLRCGHSCELVQLSPDQQQSMSVNELFTEAAKHQCDYLVAVGLSDTGFGCESWTAGRQLVDFQGGSQSGAQFHSFVTAISDKQPEAAGV